MEPLIRSIFCTANLVRRCMDRQVERVGLDCGGPHTRILGYLAHHPEEALCQRDIEQSFGLAPSTVSAMLGQLEARGLIRREAVQGDARRKRVLLTAEAWALHARIEAQARQLENLVCRGFTPAQRAQLADCLERMQENLALAVKATGELEDGGEHDA